MTEIIILDPRNAGSSGDMFLSLFIDVFDDNKTIEILVEKINEVFKSQMTVQSLKINKNGIHSTELTIDIENDIEKKEDIRKALELTNGNCEEAIKILKMARSVFFNRKKLYDL